MRGRTWHTLKENKAGYLPRAILFLDTETEAFKELLNVEYHQAKIAWTCFCKESIKFKSGYKEHWKFWTKKKELLKYITSLCIKGRCLYIVASNVTFDLVSIGFFEYFTQRKWKLKFCYTSNRTFILYIRKGRKTIRALNIQNFYEASTEQLGKMLNYPKMKVNFKTSTPEHLKEYCKRDTEIIKRAFMQYLDFITKHNLGNFRMTRASQSFTAFRHRFMEYEIEIHNAPEVLQLERDTYKGGLCECFRIGDFTGKNIICLDINSMYPFIMLHNLYPIKLINYKTNVSIDYLESVLKDYLCCAEVELQTDKAMYPVYHENRTVFPVGNFTASLCTSALEFAIEHKHIKKVNRLSYYLGAPVFNKYVKGLYPLKAKYKKSKNKVWEKLVKYFMNSLYGKTAQLLDKEIYRKNLDFNGFYREPFYDLDTGESGVMQVLFNTAITTCGKVEGTDSFCAIASHVTENARFYLQSLIHKIGIKNMLYCDTDSLIFESKYKHKLKDYLHETELGKLGVKWKSKTFKVYCPKDYEYNGKKVCKGIRGDAEEIEDNVYRQTFFPSLKTLMRIGQWKAFPIQKRIKKITRIYTKGVVNLKGFVEPFHFPLQP